MVPGLARPALAALLAVGLMSAGCGDDDGAASSADVGDSPADDYVGPGGADDTDSEDAAPDGQLGENELAIQDFEFVLQPVSAGTEVSFGNLDGASHTLTAEGGEFDTGEVVSGDSATFTAPAAGDYAVFCIIHPDITGTLVVE